MARKDKGRKYPNSLTDNDLIIGTFKLNKREFPDEAKFLEEWREANPRVGWQVLIRQLINEYVPPSDQQLVERFEAQMGVLADIIEKLQAGGIQLTAKDSNGDSQEVNRNYLANLKQAMFK